MWVFKRALLKSCPKKKKKNIAEVRIFFWDTMYMNCWNWFIFSWCYSIFFLLSVRYSQFILFIFFAANFNHRGGTFVKGTTIGTNPYRDLSVVQCQELCIRMSCKAINHVVVTATGAFECFLFSQDHTDVPLVVNLIKLRYNNYYQRTKVCEYGLNRAIEDFY